MMAVMTWMTALRMTVTFDSPHRAHTALLDFTLEEHRVDLFPTFRSASLTQPH